MSVNSSLLAVDVIELIGTQISISQQNILFVRELILHDQYGKMQLQVYCIFLFSSAELGRLECSFLFWTLAFTVGFAVLLV